MAWNLAAYGPDIAPEAEAALLAEARAMLAKPEYATTASSLHMESGVTDPVHGSEAAPEEAAPQA